MSVVDVQVLSNGQVVDPSLQLLSVDVRRELNRVPWAQLLYVDGDLPQRDFPISSSDVFAVGREVQVKAGYLDLPSSKATLFSGVVVRHAVEAGTQGSCLRIELRDKAYKLTQGRRTALYEKQTDSDVFKKLVGAAGLATGQVDSTSFQHPALVQFECSDWDFLLTRAEAMGMVVLAVDGKLSLRKLAPPGAPAIQLGLGIQDIYGLSLEIDGLAAASAASATGWNAKDEKVASARGDAPPGMTPGTSSSATLAKALASAERQLAAQVPMTPAELTAWSNAELARAELAVVRGRLTVQGLPKAALLDGMALDGMGKRFAGTVPVTGLAHRIGAEGWRTDLQLGLSAQGHHRADGLAAPPAAGLHPPHGGLGLGVVTKVHGDPDGQYRVQVALAATGDPAITVWAQVAMPVAGKESGWYLRPAVGDQVVLACLQDDPRLPVVLGSLHGPKHKPPAALFDDTADNKFSGFATRTGLSLVLDDTKKSLLIKTPAGHQVLLDDDAKAMTLKDSHGNELVLDQDGVRIKSTKDLNFEASGNVTIKGAKIDLK